jgi:pimeloyl-ACP methyl ester carboxylesterase
MNALPSDEPFPPTSIIVDHCTDATRVAGFGLVLTWRTPKYTGPERRKRPRWRPRPFRVLLVLLGLAVAGYGVAVIWLVMQESRLVVQAGSVPPTTGPPFPYKEIALPREDRVRQFAWLIWAPEPETAPWALYLHGNATTVASSVNIDHYRLLTGLGLNVLAPEYRGFGGLEGVPTESSLRDDTRAAYDYLRASRGIDTSDLVLYGWSLGSALAVDLASRERVRAVVLEAPAASLADLAQQRYPFFPLRLLMRSRFESIRRIDQVTAPILFLHGPDDEVIPLVEGRRLFEAATGDKTFVEIRAGHFDAIERDEPGIALAVHEFLTRQGLTLRDAPAPESP